MTHNNVVPCVHNQFTVCLTQRGSMSETSFILMFDFFIERVFSNKVMKYPEKNFRACILHKGYSCLQLHFKVCITSRSSTPFLQKNDFITEGVV